MSHNRQRVRKGIVSFVGSKEQQVPRTERKQQIRGFGHRGECKPEFEEKKAITELKARTWKEEGENSTCMKYKTVTRDKKKLGNAQGG